MSAFALFGSFAMANESVETSLEKKISGGSLTIYTTILDCKGEVMGRTKETIPCKDCVGANVLTITKAYCPDPNVESFPEPER